MAKKELTAAARQDEKKMRTKDLIYAGAFGAIYIVLMLIVVLATSAIPILYIVAPFTVGVVCATVYELCVLKVRKFGPALILGVLFALVACSGNILGMVLAVAAALLAELIILAGRYRSKKLFLLSFLAFNLNMVCPYTMLYFHRDEFMARSVSFYGQGFADELAKYAVNGLAFIQIGLALVGAAVGVFIACIAASLYFTADMGVSTYDAIALIITGTWGIGKFKFVRIITDCVCVALGVGLYFLAGGGLDGIGAGVGVGTIITAFFMGPLVDLFARKLARPFLYGKNAPEVKTET